LELAGADIPEYVQGLSFAPVLSGGDRALRTEIFAEKNWHGTHQYDPVRCIRTETHKYLHSFEERPAIPVPGDIAKGSASRDVDLESVRAAIELYDLTADPHELTNLAGDESVAPIEHELAERLLDWQRSTGDPLVYGPIRAARVAGKGDIRRPHRTVLIEPQFVQGD
jgi:arylsulfatase A-like enzyme